MQTAALAETCLLTEEETLLIRPLGFQLGSSTRCDVSAIYDLGEEVGRSFTHGPLFEISPYLVEIQGIQQIILGFDESDVLDAVSLTLDSELFNPITTLLGHHYELANINEPVPGSHSALFRGVNSEVSVHLPLIGAEMNVSYQTEKFMSARMKAASDAMN